MHCQENAIHYCTWGFVVGGFLYLLQQMNEQTAYGRYVNTKSPGMMVPAKAGWFIQELPSFLVPVLLFLTTESLPGIGKHLLLWTFCLHYFQRTFVFSLLTKGRPSPLYIVISAAIFCSTNGYLQGHYMLHCTQYHSEWHRDTRFITGLLIFFTGMAINIHSDYILRNLRKPGEVSYKIPRGGMFELVSGANFFGEIIEWCGYAVACWSFPAFSFALFTICSIGPRAYHHHRCCTNTNLAPKSSEGPTLAHSDVNVCLLRPYLHYFKMKTLLVYTGVFTASQKRSPPMLHNQKCMSHDHSCTLCMCIYRLHTSSRMSRLRKVDIKKNDRSLGCNFFFTLQLNG